MEYDDDVERGAQELIKRFGDRAAQTARELAEIAEAHFRGLLTAETWRDIGDAIERLSVKPRAR